VSAQAWAAVAAIGGPAVIALGFARWQGKVSAILDQLVKGQRDHEDRLRAGKL
jgi:hypothetical protein